VHVTWEARRLKVAFLNAPISGNPVGLIPLSEALPTRFTNILIFKGESSWRMHQEEEQAQSSRCRPLSRMFWQGISRRLYSTTTSLVERMNCTVSEAGKMDTISMTGCRQNANYGVP
jgi:hypothetical protein